MESLVFNLFKLYAYIYICTADLIVFFFFKCLLSSMALVLLIKMTEWEGHKHMFFKTQLAVIYNIYIQYIYIYAVTLFFRVS